MGKEAIVTLKEIEKKIKIQRRRRNILEHMRPPDWMLNRFI
jgi:hypothetical protein